MSKLEELIQQYCPDGVEWKTIDSVTKSICSGLNPRKNFTLNSSGANCNYLTVKEMASGKIVFSDKTDKITKEAVSIIQNRSRLEVDDILLSGIGTIGRVAIVDIPVGDWNCSESVILLKSNQSIINPKYLKYILECTEVQGYFNSHATGSTLKGIRQKDLRSLEIPVPPLPVQEEIVRVLDTFTELQAELQAELQKRQQQYNFYRDTLLTNYASEQNVKEYCLGELFEFKNGLNASKEQFGHGKPIVNYVNVYKKNSIVSSDLTGRVELDASTIERYRVKRGDVFFTRTSETREEVGFASVLLENIEDCVFSGFVLRARPITNVILPEFCKYCFATYEIRKQIIQSSTLTTRALTNGTSLSKVKIMIPPLEEQNRIVSILDRFDTLTNDLTSGLPAEMEKRRQQYEYYRDRLLTFKRKEA